jgi:hypothetical protein
MALPIQIGAGLSASISFGVLSGGDDEDIDDAQKPGLLVIGKAVRDFPRLITRF